MCWALDEMEPDPDYLGSSWKPSLIWLIWKYNQQIVGSLMIVCTVFPVILYNTAYLNSNICWLLAGFDKRSIMQRRSNSLSCKADHESSEHSEAQSGTSGLMVSPFSCECCVNLSWPIKEASLTPLCKADLCHSPLSPHQASSLSSTWRWLELLNEWFSFNCFPTWLWGFLGSGWTLIMLELYILIARMHIFLVSSCCTFSSLCLCSCW